MINTEQIISKKFKDCLELMKVFLQLQVSYVELVTIVFFCRQQWL